MPSRQATDLPRLDLLEHSFDTGRGRPDQVRTLVAFEPPLTELLADRERWRAFYDDLSATYRSDGLVPALQKFGEATGIGGGEPPPPATTKP
jgi:hypothetical protein